LAGASNIISNPNVSVPIYLLLGHTLQTNANPRNDLLDVQEPLDGSVADGADLGLEGTVLNANSPARTCSISERGYLNIREIH
jgi:hypothetical protein